MWTELRGSTRAGSGGNLTNRVNKQCWSELLGKGIGKSTV